ncbi:hypothetical protein V6Z77_010164 [Aspergillus fumigatus]
MGGCLRIPTDGCRRRPVPASVEADGHVRVAASVPRRRRAALGADKGARAPANWSPLAPPVSVWVSLDPVSVPGARRPTGHPRCLRVLSLGQRLSMARALACRRPAWPKGLPPTGHPPPARAAAPRRANSASQLAAARSPARLPPPPPPRPPRPPRPPPSSPSRARLSARLEAGARATGPPAPLNRLPSTGTSRAPPAALPHHIPTDLARPIIVRANVPGSERRSGEAHLRRQTARRPCGHVPQPTGHCPSSPGGGGARVPAAISAGQLARVHGGGDPEGTGRHRCPPRLRRKVSGPPSARGAAGPVDGRCLPTNLAKDRADAQRLVATRLLDRLHDPLGHFSRLQRIHPRAR